MRTIIHKLRERPPEHRKRVALLLSAGTTLAIFAIWAVTLPARFASISTQSASAGSPISSLRETFNQSYDTLKDDLSASPSAADIVSGSRVSNGVMITEVDPTNDSYAASTSPYQQ